MFETIIGFIFLFFLGTVGLILIAEFGFSVRDWALNRSQEEAEGPDSLVEPQLHLNDTPYYGRSRTSLLRRRLYRHAELVPRGRAGFAIRWRREL